MTQCNWGGVETEESKRGDPKIEHEEVSVFKQKQQKTFQRNVDQEKNL